MSRPGSTAGGVPARLVTHRINVRAAGSAGWLIGNQVALGWWSGNDTSTRASLGEPTRPVDRRMIRRLASVQLIALHLHTNAMSAHVWEAS